MGVSSRALFFVSLLGLGCANKSAEPPADAPVAGDDEDDYDPCAGKGCGDPCTICPPDDAECVETMEVKACDARGTCSSAPPVCDEPAGMPGEACTGRGCGDPETPGGRAPGFP